MKALKNMISNDKLLFTLKGLKRFIVSDIFKSDIKKFNILKDTFTRYKRTMTPNELLKLVEKAPLEVFSLKDENNSSLLHIALKNCKQRVVLTNELLMEIAKKTPQSEFSHKDKEGMLPLHLVSGMNRHHLSIPIGNSSESRELMEYIISNTPEELKTSKDSEQRTPLHIYLERGSINNLDLFLSTSPKKLFEMQNDSGHTPIHIALLRGFGESIISRIIENTPKSVFSSKDNFGSTPMHLAAVHGNAWNVNMILSNTPDETLSIKNIEGKIPLDYAIKKGFYTKELITRTPYKSLKEIDKDGNNMLHKVCYYKRFDIINNILDRTTPDDLGVQNKQKLIPLQIALTNRPYADADITDYSKWKSSYIIASIEKLIKKTPKDAFFLKDINNNNSTNMVKDFLDTKRDNIETAITVASAKKDKEPNIIRELNSDWISINKRIFKLCTLHKNLDFEKTKLSDKLLQMAEPFITNEKELIGKGISISK